MARGNNVGISWGRIRQREKHSDESDEEYKVGEDEEGDDESDEYCSLDSDESEEEDKLERVARSRTIWKTSSVRKGNETKKPRKRRRVSYMEMDDDDDEEDENNAVFMSLGRKENQIKKSEEEKTVSYIEEDEEDDEDDEEFMSSDWEGNQIKRPRQNRISYTETDDYDDDEAEEEGDDDSEFISGRKVNQTKRSREKKMVSYTEEDNAEFIPSSRKEYQVKKPREKGSVSYREEEDDEEEVDDDDDEEFVLTETDFVDDDDEELKMMKSEKVSRYHPQKRSFQGGHEKRGKSEVYKKPMKPKPRNRRLKRKVSSTRDRRVRKSYLEVEERNKKISNQRRRRAKAESDSDSVSSVSSHHEYTISEEEREQMREAKVCCANLRAKLRNSSSKRQEEEPLYAQTKPPLRKGKEKVESMKDDLGKQVCGICLSEEGKRTVKGVLDCCRHHFCFSCIMEWSKVESRCPLCKQRFATITKAARSVTGFDLRTVVVSVPERDQIYQPSEEEVRGYLDPYESVICTECHHGGEDAFMLLCDICDSPAHTFCVGLGQEVPEGNWYCDGCRTTVFSSLNSEHPTPSLRTNTSDFSSPIAGGFDLNEVYVPEIPSTQETRILPEPRMPTGDFIPAGTVATTLRDRRRIHRQIHRQFLNNNRLSDLIARPSGTAASSTGIRLFGSHLDQARDLSPQQIVTPERASHPHVVVDGKEDHVMPFVLNNNLFSASTNQLIAQLQNSTFTSLDGSMQAELGESAMAFNSRFGYAQLHPCTNGSSVGYDESLSPYPFSEATGPSRAPQGSLHAPY